MKVKTVKYGRTVCKDYQSRKVEVEIELEEGEKFGDGLNAAKAIVHKALGLVPRPDDVAKARETVELAEHLDSVEGL